MIPLSSLDEIANYLEQHENSTRIKKLIFCACKNVWENDQDTLDKFKLQKLIQELCNSNPNRDKLNTTLSNIVNTLNKPDEYSIIANLIINEIQKLYLTSDENTGIISNQCKPEEATGIVLNQSHQNKSIFTEPEKISSKNPIKSQYNQFDFRQNIMKYTNPLRAKIVIFSVIYHTFSFTQEDWFKLRAEELDSLLQRLFNSCSTISELESKLNTAVISLGKLDENTQAAGAIIQCMRSFYDDISTSNKPYQPLNNYSSHQNLLTDIDDNFEENDDDGDNTCQIIVPPNTDRRNK